MTEADINHRFTYHAPDEAKAQLHTVIRDMLREAALDMNDLLPEGREKSLAVTRLEESMFWANAALARYVPAQDQNLPPEALGT